MHINKLDQIAWTIASKTQAAKKVVDASRHPLLRRALRSGVAPASEHNAILRRVDASVCVDVGAHRGQFSLAVRGTLPACRILAFEPLPDIYPMTAALFAEDPNFEVRNLAIADAPGVKALQISGHDDSSSLLPIGDRQSELFPGREAVNSVEVEVSTLDQEIELADLGSAALLKIDVQGAELAVLKGASATLAGFKYIYVECSTTEMYVGQPLASEVITHLFERGFTMCDIGHVTRVGSQGAVQADFLFRKV